MGESGFIFQPFHFDGSRDESLFRVSWFPFHGNPGQYFLFLCFQLEGHSLAHLPFFISCKNHQVGCIRRKPFIDLDKISRFGPGLVDPPPEGSEKTWFWNNHQGTFRSNHDIFCRTPIHGIGINITFIECRKNSDLSLNSSCLAPCLLKT